MGHDIPDHQIQYDTANYGTGEKSHCNIHIVGNGIEKCGYD